MRKICDMELAAFQKRTWAQINIDSVKYNFDKIKDQIKQGTKICCVIKANAYGHGAVQMAHIYEEIGADYFAVSNIEEALQLRRANITLPILVLGYTDPQCASLLSVNNISQCVFSKEYGKDLSNCASIQRVDVKVHIKLDTGMGRIGFTCQNIECTDDVAYTCKLPNIIAEGIFTHFASADEGIGGKDYTKKQFNRFQDAIDKLEKEGISFSIRHCANSAAIFDYPEMQLDMVRAGIVLYGLQPSDLLNNKADIKQVMTLHSIVDHIKITHKGDFISYGRTYEATENRKIATIPIGYADGLWRSNVNNGITVEINNQLAPIVGRICMDQCMVDVTDVIGAEIGSPVIVYGVRKENSIDHIAQINGTINYEVVCALGERVPRVFIENDCVVKIIDNILEV